MTTLMTDPDDGCMMGTVLPPPPGFIPPTIAESLARGFDDETSFWVCDGKPIALWEMWDYAENWSKHPIDEIHPFIPVIYGKEIAEAEFKALVKALHSLS